MSQRVPIDVPLTVRELAQMTEPPTRTHVMRRRLLRWHSDSDKTLLVKVEGRWHCTLASLRRVWPSFGEKFAEQEDVDDLSARTDKNEGRIRSVEVGLQNFKAKANSWFRDAEKRLAALEAARQKTTEANTQGP